MTWNAALTLIVMPSVCSSINYDNKFLHILAPFWTEFPQDLLKIFVSFWRASDWRRHTGRVSSAGKCPFVVAYTGLGEQRRRVYEN